MFISRRDRGHAGQHRSADSQDRTSQRTLQRRRPVAEVSVVFGTPRPDRAVAAQRQRVHRLSGSNPSHASQGHTRTGENGCSMEPRGESQPSANIRGQHAHRVVPPGPGRTIGARRDTKIGSRRNGHDTGQGRPPGLAHSHRIALVAIGSPIAQHTLSPGDHRAVRAAGDDPIHARGEFGHASQS